MEKGPGRWLCLLALLTGAQLAHAQTLVAQDDVIADRLEDAGLFSIQLDEILGNDQLPPGVTTGDLTVIAADSAVGGSVFLDGALQFRTPADYFGPASFRYTVQEPGGQTSSATASMTIVPVNDPPSFSDRGDLVRFLGELAPPAYPGWAFNFDFGEGEDDRVAEFVVTIVDDPDDALASANVSKNGTLTIVTTGNVGIATLDIRLRDDGGTLNGGVDLSPARLILFEVTAFSDLRVTKTNELDVIPPSTVVTYVISVFNAGAVDLPEVRVRDEMPPQLQLVSWTCDALETASCGATFGLGDIDEIVSLPMNGEVLFFVNGAVLGEPGTLVVNTASATGPAGLIEITPDNNVATDADLIGGEGALFKSGFEEGERPVR